MVDNEKPSVYKNPYAPVETRVKDLLSRMTLPEKIGQMTLIERSVASPAVITGFSIGIHKPLSLCFGQRINFLLFLSCSPLFFFVLKLILLMDFGLHR